MVCKRIYYFVSFCFFNLILTVKLGNIKEEIGFIDSLVVGLLPILEQFRYICILLQKLEQLPLHKDQNKYQDLFFIFFF
jgi:hypothetical protein